MRRTETSTAKLKTEFGTHYVRVSHVSRDITDVRISSPGKFNDTGIGKMLEDIGHAIHGEIVDIHKRHHK